MGEIIIYCICHRAIFKVSHGGSWFENEMLTKIMPKALETMEMGLRRTWDRKGIWITQGLFVFIPWKPSVAGHHYVLADTTNIITVFPMKLF